jgi:AraC-like DNA-binding protein
MNSLPIYSINEFPTSSKDFYVNDLAYHLENNHFIHFTHKHDFFLCVLFLQGSGQHIIDFQTYEIQPGSIFFLSPGQFHNWKFDKKAEGFIFFHSKEFYNLTFQQRQIHDFPFYFSDYNSPLLNCDENSLNEITPLFKALFDESLSQQAFSSAKLVTLVDLLYIQLSRYYIAQVSMEIRHSKSMLKLRQIENLVDAHFREMKTPSDYANLLNMSTKHLNRIIKTAINKTATELIADRIILEAKRLLIHSDIRVTEVADQLGFQDYSYFNRFFKKHTSQTPVEFQKSQINQ